MADRVGVVVYANDSVSELGIVSQLRGQRPVVVLEDRELDGAEVAVVVIDQIDAEALRLIRAVQRQGELRVVVVAGRLDASSVLSGVEAGVCGFLRRSDTRPETLVAAVERAAAGDGTLPEDLLGRVLRQMSQAHNQVLSPRGLSLSTLNQRETEVLRLLADGYNTAEVAQKLNYSERTVKNILADVTRRFNLRNRTHAVAYALRQGII